MPRRTTTKTPLPATVSSDEGLIRLETVLELFPVSESAWYRGIAEGRYPRAVRLGARTAAWRLTDIRQLLARVAADADDTA